MIPSRISAQGVTNESDISTYIGSCQIIRSSDLPIPSSFYAYQMGIFARFYVIGAQTFAVYYHASTLAPLFRLTPSQTFRLPDL